jgi:hypothetical protein
MSDFEALLARFEGVRVSDRSDAVSAFASICGCDVAQATFFLEAGGSLEAAINLFLNAQGGAPAPRSARPQPRAQGAESEAIDEDLQAAIAASMEQFATQAPPGAGASSAPPPGAAGSGMADEAGSSGAMGSSSGSSAGAGGWQLPAAQQQQQQQAPPTGFSFASPTFQLPGSAGASGFQPSPPQQFVFGSPQQQPFGSSWGAAAPTAPPPGAAGSGASLFGMGSAAPVFGAGGAPVFGMGTAAGLSFGASAPPTLSFQQPPHQPQPPGGGFTPFRQ